MRKIALATLSILALAACGQPPTSTPALSRTAPPSGIQSQGYWPTTQSECDAAGWDWSNVDGCSEPALPPGLGGHSGHDPIV